jgi:uncharacterized protein
MRMSIQRRPTVDTFELAGEQRTIAGELALADLPRLLPALADSRGSLHYRITGGRDEQGRPCADMQLSGRPLLECQRCGGTFEFALERAAPFRFVGSEEELDGLPLEEDEVDVIAGDRQLDLARWVEDEAILSLPLVPRHAEGDPDCRPAVPLAESDDDTMSGARPSPFAALAGVKVRRRSS